MSRHRLTRRLRRATIFPTRLAEHASAGMVGKARQTEFGSGNVRFVIGARRVMFNPNYLLWVETKCFANHPSQMVSTIGDGSACAIGVRNQISYVRRHDNCLFSLFVNANATHRFPFEIRAALTKAFPEARSIYCLPHCPNFSKAAFQIYACLKFQLACLRLLPSDFSRHGRRRGNSNPSSTRTSR
jgi:hypothetical protein